MKGVAVKVSKAGSGPTVLSCKMADGSITGVKTDAVVLMAVGRDPNVAGLGLEAVGIPLNERGGIETNERLRTAVKSIYAAGDCTGDLQL